MESLAAGIRQAVPGQVGCCAHRQWPGRQSGSVSGERRCTVGTVQRCRAAPLPRHKSVPAAPLSPAGQRGGGGRVGGDWAAPGGAAGHKAGPAGAVGQGGGGSCSPLGLRGRPPASADRACACPESWLHACPGLATRSARQRTARQAVVWFTNHACRSTAGCRGRRRSACCGRTRRRWRPRPPPPPTPTGQVCWGGGVLPAPLSCYRAAAPGVSGALEASRCWPCSARAAARLHLPPAPAHTSSPAAGMRFKCISCDTALQPFLFAAAPGAGGAGGGAGYPHTADLRYSQLPMASPARNPSQPWTAAVAPGVEALAAGGPAAGEAPRLSAMRGPTGDAVRPLSPQSVRPASSAAARLASPARWAGLQWQMRTGACSVS